MNKNLLANVPTSKCDLARFNHMGASIIASEAIGSGLDMIEEDGKKTSEEIRSLVEKIKALRSINGLVFDDMPFSPIEVELQRIEGKLSRLKSGLAYCDYSTGSLNRFLERLPSDRGPHPIIRTLGEAPQQTNAMILQVYGERFIDLHLSHLVDAAALYTGAPKEQIKTAIEMQPRIKAKWMNWMENHLKKKYLVDGEFSDQRELSVGNELLKYLLNALKLEFNSGYPVSMNLEELAQEIVTRDREVLIDHLSRSKAPLLGTCTK